MPSGLNGLVKLTLIALKLTTTCRLGLEKELSMTAKASPLKNERIMVAVTGASGAIYAERLIEELIKRVTRVYLCVSETGKKVVHYELDRREGPLFSLRRALAGD